MNYFYICRQNLKPSQTATNFTSRNMNLWNHKCIYYFAFTCLLFGSCSSSHDEDIDPTQPDAGGSVAVSKFGLDRQSVLDHFSKSLKGQSDTFEVSEIGRAHV